MGDAVNPFQSPRPESAEAYVRAEIHGGAVWTSLVDRFEFFVPEIHEVESQAILFYEGTKARLISREPLTFRRGSLWATVLGPERYARQRIVLEVDQQHCRVRLAYYIQLWLTARVYYNSYIEAVRLATHLGAVHPDTLAQR